MNARILSLLGIVIALIAIFMPPYTYGWGLVCGFILGANIMNFIYAVIIKLKNKRKH